MRFSIRLQALALAAALSGAIPSFAPAQSAGEIDFDSLRDETARLLSEYIRINTSNPPGNELAAARWLQQVLAREGIEGQILDTAELGPGRANFYARIKGNGSAKAIALVHHMDVVPATREQWSVDPFGGEIKDGSVWGRGALDMKGQAVVHLMALIAMKRMGLPLTRDLVLIGNADEESDGLGTRTFIARHPDLLADVEYLLTETEQNRVENGKVRWFGIDVGEKRIFWRRVTVKGTAEHGSEPTGHNPVPRLAKIIARLDAWQTPLRVVPAVDRYFKSQASYSTGEGRRWLANAEKALLSPRGRAWLLSDPERNALLRNTVSPTVLTGSDKTNSIPGEASVELDIRLLPDEDTVAFRRELLRVIADTGAVLTSVADTPPRYDAPLGTDLFHAIETVVGRLLPGVPVASPINVGGSDRPYYAETGIICYGVSPFLVEFAQLLRQYHGIDERMPLESLGFGLRLYIGILREMENR
ncbi:MAG: M20/M25/M40 family metallo-hydrolase [Gemmatimonadales bacterium]